jgi:pimeloyl-ACP methyl ester carboxylesterase
MTKHKIQGKKYLFMTGLVASLYLLTALLTEASAEEVTQEFNGLTVNANLELAPGSALEEGVVLVLHGPLAHNRMEIIENIQRALAENGRNSLAINLSLAVDNRHGFYDCTIPHQHTQEDTIDEISAWVGWLRQQGVTNVVLLGHSRGANQAMVYAATSRDPEVKQLILLAPGTADIQEAYKGRYGNDLEKLISQAKAMVAANRGEELMTKTDFMICPQTDVSAKTFLSHYDADVPFNNFEKFLPQLKLPTLITTGSMDDRFPHTQEKVAPYADGKLIRLNEVEGAGHFFRDFNIDEAMEAAVEFLDDSKGT